MPLRFEEILAQSSELPAGGEVLGTSRENRPLHGYRFGAGDFKISLIAGCHADEPVGPMLLRRLVRCLASLPEDHEALAGQEWWIVPDANPDGAARNAAWTSGVRAACDLVDYLDHVQRELPGDDVEFGFPRQADDSEARPENRAIYEWWSSNPRPFRLHASLHGMAFAAGPWFLVEGAWRERCRHWMERCRERVREMAYRLHDVDRGGEKGFHRIAPGFSTRPDSNAMIRFFLERGDERTAARFRPSSMEAIRARGGDPLTLVSEMPLFLVPDLASAGPVEPEAMTAWRDRLARWKMMRIEGIAREEVERRIRAARVHAMPVHDQMELQWTMIRAGIEQVGRDER